MSAQDELRAIAERLEDASRRKEYVEAKSALEELQKAAAMAEAAFCGSWLGYHSCVYYKNIESPPVGAHFSQKWGFKARAGSDDTIGDWEVYDRVRLIDELKAKAGSYSFEALAIAGHETTLLLKNEQNNVESIIASQGYARSDTFVDKITKEIAGIRSLDRSQIERAFAPKGEIISSDVEAMDGGIRVPPHVTVTSLVLSYKAPFKACENAGRLCRTLAVHLERIDKKDRREARIGTNVFIGHGRSKDWRELKDFVVERLHLPFDEFNRVPIAGVTNIARLQEMLDSAAIAFVIMTAEDELADGAVQARQNVIHEVGLFQGRLGFTKAIVLFEEGCAEFSNIHGLGQIIYPRGRISATFEDIRRICEREGLIEA